MTRLPIWLMVAALGQAPADDGLLDAVPAEADVVLRARGLTPIRDDLLAMLKAASPRLADQATPTIDAGLAQVREHVGDAAATPFVIAIRAVAPENPGRPPVIVLLRATDYEGFLRGIADNKDVAIKHEEGGVDSFTEKDGQTLFASRAGGVIGFGTDRALVAAFAKSGGPRFGKALAPALRSRLLAGDVGAYANVAALTGRYKDQIAQARRQMAAGLDQAGQQLGNTAMTDITKAIYAGFFDSLEEVDALAMSVDLSAAGATVDGALSLKAGSKALESIAGAKTGDASALGKLPADATTFMYLNLDARSFEAFQKLSLGMMLSGGKPSPELDAALEKQRAAGRVETIASMTMTGGMKMFSLYKMSDPKAFRESVEAMTRAIKGSDSPLNLYKDISIARGVETYGGYAFDRIEMTVDPAKVEKLTAGNPAQAAQMKGMLGVGKMTSWYGLGDAQVLQLTAPSWDQAKARIDAFQKGEATLGATASYGEALSRLPKDVNGVMLLSVQGLVRQVAAQLGGPPIDDLPKEPVLIGASMRTVPRYGFEFRLVLPSAIGPIIEKRMGGPAPAPGNP